MSEKRLLQGKFECNKKINEEEFEYYYDNDISAFEVYQKIIGDFNNEELKRNMKDKKYPVFLRKALSANWFDSVIKYCDFKKVSIHSLKDSKGYYDLTKCVNCGRKRRRRYIDSSDISNIICRTDKKNSLLYKRKIKKRGE
jgi:hypothetical protein